MGLSTLINGLSNADLLAGFVVLVSFYLGIIASK